MKEMKAKEIRKTLDEIYNLANTLVEQITDNADKIDKKA